MMEISDRELIRRRLIGEITGLGFPDRFGELIASALGSVNAMDRMLSYLYRYQPSTAEEIADEMLAIKEEFAGYRDKKISEYNNMRYNEYLNSDLREYDDET